MFKNIKRATAIFLATIMLVLPAAGVAASTIPTLYEENVRLANDMKTPIVKCGGAFHTLYNELGEAAYPIGLGVDILGGLSDMGTEIVNDVIAFRWESIADKLSAFLWDMMGDFRFDKNGEPVNKMYGNEKNNQQRLDEKWIDAYYDFDWRDDPIRQAGILHEYIGKVKQANEVQKVILTAQSGSGHLGAAYLDIYGSEDEICAYLLRASLHNGSSIFGDIVNKRLKFDDNALADANFYDEFGIPEETKNLLVPTFKLLRDTGILRVITSLGTKVVNKIMDRFYEKAIIPVLLSQPVYWAYVPIEDYESGIQTIYGKDARTGEWAGLVKKLDAYNEIKLRFNDILKEYDKKMRVGIIANYGAPLFPAVENSYVHADILVDTVYSSCGATVAPFGETLKGSFFGIFPYKQKVNDGHNHLSPDGIIDASTCALPETTWLFSGGMHFDINDNGLINWFFRNPGKTDVFSDERYPQFLMRDENKMAVPLVVEKKTFNLMDYMFSKLLSQIRFFVDIYTWWL